ncbi:putative protein phosphatase 2A regulatory subunit B [Gregarina niphandrodes]|uniref:Serine/threonine protein phosphatase 2A regulatory subunit n=1 Tax=Gregarina niphandrodes TaxID=110365 RepID=A0A023AYX6_GRENI|nr:putative protein phosphatase 2A regulatory subunit B [Gregarina niphandrodes]EZG43658.1 putative protein phosphatase 2A regulatory subunit B [Gregarina niphandrodes]|eukprot:XP_011133112.1 putative protein phosphatase 2A regulatory subunit B [Gregarina niphandrodes]
MSSREHAAVAESVVTGPVAESVGTSALGSSTLGPSSATGRMGPSVVALPGPQSGKLDRQVFDGGGKGLFRALSSPSEFSALPALKEVSGLEAWKLFRVKVNLCGSVVFNFGECIMRPRGVMLCTSYPVVYELYNQEIQAKHATLQEVLQFIGDNRQAGASLDAVAEEVVHMAANNIFRPLPPTSSAAVAAAALQTLVEDDLDCALDPVYVAGWLHLQLVYEIFLTLIVSPCLGSKTSKRLVDQNFMLRLLALFSSEDVREREYLKTITHRLYGKVTLMRSFIRKSIENIFVLYIEDHFVKSGVSELLEILGSIINGFAQPLKDEHLQFLHRCMIPLHKAKNVIAFHQQLSYCMVQYVEKDCRLATPIILGILKYWPISNTPKEVLFINEIEDILDVVTPPQDILLPLFKKLSQCIKSPHFQISERTLFLWNNPKIIKLVNQNKQALYPIVIAALQNNTQSHWNFTVHSLSFNVSKLLAEADPRLYAQCTEELTSIEEPAECRRRDDDRWKLFFECR